MRVVKVFLFFIITIFILLSIKKAFKGTYDLYSKCYIDINKSNFVVT
jgi:hypothetical protein